MAQIPVAVSILITEGVRTVVGAVRIEGNTSVPEATLRRLLGLQPGRAVLRRAAAARYRRLQLEYANLGYRSATVEAQPGFTPDRAQANVVFTVREGPQVFVDHMLIVGNVRTSAETIERELQLKPGDPLSLEAEYESQRRLAALQLFRRAPQLTELRHGDETPARPARDGRGSGADDARLRRRRRGPAARGGQRGRGRRRRAEVRARARARSSTSAAATCSARTGRSNFFASVSLHPEASSSSARLGYGFTEYRVLAHVPRAASVRHGRRRRRERHVRAADPIELQLLAPERHRSGVAAADAHRQRERRVSAAAHAACSTSRSTGRSAADRPPVHRRCGCRRFRCRRFYDTRDEPVDRPAASTRARTGSSPPGGSGRRSDSSSRSSPRRRSAWCRVAAESVFAAQARLGIATRLSARRRQTIARRRADRRRRRQDLPEPERFFAGGDTTVRGFALDALGRPDTITDGFPIGGNGGNHLQRRAAQPGAPGAPGRRLRRHRQRVRRRVRHRSRGCCGPRSASASATSRRSGRSGSTWVSRSTPSRASGRSAWFITFGQAF